MDRGQIARANLRREKYYRGLQNLLGPHDLLCLPTTPAPAPLKGTLGDDRTSPALQTYYPRTLSLTAIAGLGKLPQVSLPLADLNGAPLGLSLLAAHGNDAFLLAAMQQVDNFSP